MINALTRLRRAVASGHRVDRSSFTRVDASRTEPSLALVNVPRYA